jgi:hypothetical protein
MGYGYRPVVTVREHIDMRLGGWIRLWVFAAICYLAVVVAVSFLRFPTQEASSVNSLLPHLSLESLLAMKSAGNLPSGWKDETVDGRIVPVPMQLAEPSRSMYIADYSLALAAELRERRQTHVLVGLAWWLGPTVLTLLLGLGITWVRVGFRARDVP